MTPNEMAGQIITFYSYKGGTGRTMALANVACLLANSSGRAVNDDAAPVRGVLMIDWDLEAPGLHNYFRAAPDNAPSHDDPAAQDQLGLIDLFLEIDAATRPNDKGGTTASEETAPELFEALKLDRFIRPTRFPNLYLMQAGRFDEDYPDRVNSFPWEDLYHRAPWLIPAFADHLANKYRYVFIDSRTGVTDTSGICTTLIPEKLVVVFTPNSQSLTGLSDLVRRAVLYRRRSDDWRPLVVFPVVSRVEMARPALLEYWRFGDQSTGFDGFQKRFEILFQELYALEDCNLKTFFDEVQLQHVPDYAYGEQLAVEVERSDSRLSLKRSYENFTERLVTVVGPWEDLGVAEARHRADGFRRRAERLLGAGSPAGVEEASQLLKQAVELAGKFHLTYDPKLTAAFSKLGGVLLESRRFEEAASSARSVLAYCEGTLGNDHPELAARLDELAHALAKLGRSEDALNALMRALEVREKSLGREHPAVATNLEDLAGLCNQLGRLSRSEEYLERALSIRRSALGPDAPETANSLEALAQVAANFGNFEKAERLYQEAFSIRERSLPEDHPDRITSQVNLARLADAQGEIPRAVDLYTQALRSAEHYLGTQHPLYAILLVRLADVFMKQGRSEPAEPLLQRALELSRANGDARFEAEVLLRLGDIHTSFGQVYLSRHEYETSLSRLRESGDRPVEGHVLERIGDLHAQEGRVDEAIAAFEEALRLFREVGDRSQEASILGRLASALLGKDQTARAIECAEKQLAIYGEIGHIQGQTQALNLLGLAYLHTRELEKAIRYLQLALVNAQKTGDRGSQFHALINLYKTHVASGASDAADFFLWEAERVGRQLGHPEFIAEASKIRDIKVSE